MGQGFCFTYLLFVICFIYLLLLSAFFVICFIFVICAAYFSGYPLNTCSNKGQILIIRATFLSTYQGPVTLIGFYFYELIWSSTLVLICCKRKQCTLLPPYTHESSGDYTGREVWVWESSWISGGNVDGPLHPA